MVRRSPALVALTVLVGAFSFVNTPAAQAEGELSPVMVVLDSSGSMTAKDAGGGTSRMDAAKRAVSGMVDSLPAQARVGLTIYGANTGSSGAEKAAGCRDVRVVRGVSPVDKPAIKRAVGATKPRGYTPIGTALRTAAGQLPAEGQRSIVLVSDGEDTCAPPQPCDVAKDLHRKGVDLHVHTIGFRVDAKARAQLACIAQSTGGTYHDASDAGSLRGVLGRVTERALRKYEPVGTPVTGTADPTTAPTIQPGQYLDTLNGREERFYAADLRTGDTAYFAATAVFPRGNPNQIESLDIEIKGPGNAECYKSEREIDTRVREGSQITTLLSWNGLVPGASGRKECKVPGRYTFRITRVNDANDGGTDRVPVEISYRIEPPVVGDRGEPAQNSLVEFAQQPSGATRPISGGGSFNEATTIAGPGRYREAMYYGEELFYRVKLDWGQGLAYRVTFAGESGAEIVNIRTALYNPVRDEMDNDTTAYTNSTKTLPTTGEPIATPRVVYLNRNANNSDLRKAAIDGWYYIAVRLGAASGLTGDGTTTGVPMTLDLAIAGDKVAGPEYGATDSSTPSPSTSPSSSPSESVSPSESPDPDSAGGPITTQPVSDDSSSALPWVIVAAMLVLAAAIVASALLLRRRRPATPTGGYPPQNSTGPGGPRGPSDPGQGGPGGPHGPTGPGGQGGQPWGQ